MPFVNYTETYKTARISTQHQIGVHFVCPVCGKDSGWIDKEVNSDAEYTGLESVADKLAYDKAEFQLNEMLDHMNAENMTDMIGGPVKCPNCGAPQLSGNVEQNSRKGCLPYLLGGIALLLVGALYLFLPVFKKTFESVLLVYGILLVLGIGVIVAFVLSEKRRKKLAEESPAAQLKYLGTVRNDCIEVDFRGRGPGGIVAMVPSEEPDGDDEDEDDDEEE